MKVIIAEDELLERKAMRKFLEEHFTDLEVVGEAVNGRKAIELAESFLPDIMLMDIKMPGLSGIEAMERIHQANPSIKFIMVTAYDSFDYAKKAMKLGVREYILKPSKKEETIRAILRVKKEIDQEQQTLDNRRALFLTKLIQGEDVSRLKLNLFTKMQSGFFFVMSEMVKLPSEYIQHDKIGFYPSNVILDNGTVLKKIQALQLELGTVYIGVGHPYANLTELATSYYEAKQALRHLVEAGQKKYGFPPKVEESPDIDGFLQVLKEGNEDSVWAQFDEICHQLDMEAYYKIKQVVEDKSLKFPECPFEQLTTSEDWRDFLQMVCLEIRHHFQSQTKIERAKQFIKEHYQDQISLEDVSEYTDLSMNYLSNLFRETTGRTFSDYLTSIRIKMAKELLQENQASLKEISFEIGYRDPNYFSRVFKKYEGISPKQYQNQIVK
ncbi:response regulator [Gracilibacillus massiliensis]|uniref:response regulator n=1 Tax=Gracilibacillus massiliensis TaxID=1564956 RepID=UPI00071D8BC8|nr:response regulator [Gracilibacillus massiliensis]